MCRQIASWMVAGLGVPVSMFGWYLTPDAWSCGIFGFGLAHILLGFLDMFRRSADNDNA
ncbi:hypothetical protein [Paenibacillus ehimensis]|uniref:Uncharacterized protein n=2 Tax=Paenibacillus ehimensis TaxID=79264 RepID=A0ABT8V4I8_9BACL|nr:hypothetical protein [Paenibacillus ehimensis]MDO3676348.1 hypothetical protein [Paenibacillus ehimensis]